MSACISRYGEYSAHKLDPEEDPLCCALCGAFDEAAAYAAARRADALAASLEAVRALADEWAQEADEDERWLNGPRVAVSEAQEYPATIRQARAHVAALRDLCSQPAADRTLAELHAALDGGDDA